MFTAKVRISPVLHSLLPFSVQRWRWESLSQKKVKGAHWTQCRAKNWAQRGGGGRRGSREKRREEGRATRRRFDLWWNCSVLGPNLPMFYVCAYVDLDGTMLLVSRNKICRNEMHLEKKIKIEKAISSFYYTSCSLTAIASLQAHRKGHHLAHGRESLAH